MNPIVSAVCHLLAAIQILAYTYAMWRRKSGDEDFSVIPSLEGMYVMFTLWGALMFELCWLMTR